MKRLFMFLLVCVLILVISGCAFIPTNTPEGHQRWWEYNWHWGYNTGNWPWYFTGASYVFIGGYYVITAPGKLWEAVYESFPAVKERREKEKTEWEARYNANLEKWNNQRKQEELNQAK